jgi:hypothetical protein
VAGGAGAAEAGAAFDADERGGFDADELGRDAELLIGALPTVTSGVILPIVDAETPAFDKSLTDE